MKKEKIQGMNMVKVLDIYKINCLYEAQNCVQYIHSSLKKCK